MAAVKAYYIRCDWPDCRKAFGPVERGSAIRAREVAYSNGWARSGNDDRCPEHHSGKRKRKNTMKARDLQVGDVVTYENGRYIVREDVHLDGGKVSALFSAGRTDPGFRVIFPVDQELSVYRDSERHS